MSAIYKEPLSVLKRLLFVAMVILGMTVATTSVQAAGVISGTVYNDVNDNLSFNVGTDYTIGAGATVALQTTAGVELATATTNAAGEYTFPSQAAGNYKILVKTAPTGYVTVGTEVKTVIVASTAVLGNNLAVRGSGGSIAGKVYNDADISSSFTPVDINQAGIQVYLKKGGTTISTVTTTASGYSFKNLPNDAYTIEVDASDLDENNLVVFTSINGTGDTPKKTITLTSLASAMADQDFFATENAANGIDGIVYNDVNDDNANVAGEDLLTVGAKVNLYYNDGTTLVGKAEITTPATGAYQFKNIPLGKYKVKVTAPTGYTAKVNPLSVVVSDSASSYALQDFPLTAAASSTTSGSISGYAFIDASWRFNSTSGNPEPDGSSVAISSVKVELFKNDVLYLTQFTKSNGIYSFKGLPADTYKVKLDISSSAIPAGYRFEDDSDGKIAGVPDGIITIAVNNNANTQRNFFFLPNGTNTIPYYAIAGVHPPAGGHSLGSYLNGVPISGINVPGKVRLYHFDKVTPVFSTEWSIGSGTIWSPQIPYGRYWLRHVSHNETGWSAISDIYFPVRSGGNLDRFMWVTGNTNTGTVANSGLKGKVYINKNGTTAFDGDDTLVDKVQLRLTRTDGTARGYAVGPTLSNGTYGFQNLPKGTYKVEIASLGYVAGGAQLEYAGDSDGGNDQILNVTLDATGVAVADQDIWLKVKSSADPYNISGTVQVDTYGDGKISDIVNSMSSPADAWAHNVKVELLSATDQVLDTKTTGANGAFSFAALSPSTTYKVRVSKTGYSVILGGDPAVITFGSTPDINLPVKFLIKGKSGASGAPNVDFNGDGVFNDGGQRYSSQTDLSVWDNSAWRFLVRYAHTGSHNFANLGPDKYRITTNLAPVYGNQTNTSPANTIYFEVLPTTTTVFATNFWTGSADNNSGGTVTGSILLDSNNNGTIENTGDLGGDQPLTGTSVAGTTVEFYRTHLLRDNFAMAPTYTAIVDANGNYTLPAGQIPGMGNYIIKIKNLPTGFIVKNDADGNTKPTESVFAPTIGTIQLVRGTAVIQKQDFLVTRSPMTQISGRVYYDINYDNDYDDAVDSGFGGQTIVLEKGGIEVGRQQVNDKGGYIFTNLLDGTYTVSLVAGNIPAGMVEAPKSAEALTVLNRTVTISTAEPNFIDRNFWYNKSGEAGIAGTVYADMDNDGLPNLNGDYPLAGVTVTLKKAGNSVKTTTTSARGAYKFTGSDIISGDYTVELTVPTDYSVYKTSGGDTIVPRISVTVGSTSGMISGRYFLLAGNTNNNPNTGAGSATSKASGLSGYLYKGSSAAVPTGNRLSGVSVSIYDGATLLGHDKTDVDGKYQFFNLPAKAYTVVLDETPSGLSIVGDADLTAPLGSITTTLVANTGKINQNMWFAENSEDGIAGKVTYSGKGLTTVDSLDVPVKDISVELYDSANLTSPMYTTTTDVDGNYHFDNIPTISYQIKVLAADKTAKGYKGLNPANGDLVVTNLPVAGLTNQNFILGGLRTLSGKVQKDTNGDTVIDDYIANLDTTLLWAGPDGDFTTPGDNVQFGSVAATGSVTVIAGKTDGAGQYSYGNLPQGEYRVGYATADPLLNGLAMMVKIGNTAPPRTVSLTVNKSDVHFDYEPLATLSGAITFDRNGNNNFDTGDSQLLGVSLHIYKETPAGSGTYVKMLDGSNQPIQAITGSIVDGNGNQTGQFQFPNISYGNYRVEVQNRPTTMTLIRVGQGTLNATNHYIQASLTNVATTQNSWNLLYGITPGQDTVVTLRTRSDSNPNNQYDPLEDVPLGNVLMHTNWSLGGIGIITDVWTSATTGNVQVTLPRGGQFGVFADMNSALQNQGVQPVYTLPSENAVPPNSGVIQNMPLTASTAEVVVGYRGNLTPGTGY